MVGVVIEDNHFHPAGQQQTANDLPVAAKSGNNDARLLFVNFIGFALLLATRFFQTRQHHQQNRRRGHRQRDRERQRFRPFWVEDVCHLCCAKDHKRKFAPLPQQNRKPAALLIRHLERTRNQPQHRHFNDQEANQQDDDPQRVRHQRAEVDGHPHADEKQPQQQAFKRLDIAFQRVTVFRTRQQNACEERPHRHRQPGFLQQQTKAKHQEERHGAEHFAKARAGNEPQQRTGDVATKQHHQRQRPHHF